MCNCNFCTLCCVGCFRIVLVFCSRSVDSRHLYGSNETFVFATGAGYCLNRPLVHAMMPYIHDTNVDPRRGLVAVCHSRILMASDDVAIGFLANYVSNTNI